SFQLCKQLDPQDNPSLFNSTLSIIIRVRLNFDLDPVSQIVIGYYGLRIRGDSYRVHELLLPPPKALISIYRFHKQFQRVVEKERNSNFLTRLHKGRLSIIPWPIIGSPGFYEQFEELKELGFDVQEITHKQAGVFLTTLKMLMAKLKLTNLKANLAAQRVEKLSSLLVRALCFGLTDPEHNEVLK
ncbi:12164_t:CDS:2, partial [Acaulospora colombiana]